MAGRYKFSDPRSMPKFGAGPNPFKGKAEEKKREGRGEKEDADARLMQANASQEEGIVEKVREVAAVEVEKSGKQSDRPDVEKKAEASELRIEEENLPSREAAARQAEEETEKDGVQKASRPEKRPGWILRIGSLTSSLRMKLWKPRKSAPPPRPIQGELSLDNIKPVRNDLSDTDLEVVPLRTSAIVKAKAKARNREENDSEPQQPQPQEQDFIEAGRT